MQYSYIRPFPSPSYAASDSPIHAFSLKKGGRDGDDGTEDGWKEGKFHCSSTAIAFSTDTLRCVVEKAGTLGDALVSGGVKRASMETLTIMASGSNDSVGLVLAALSDKLYIIKSGCGAGSGIKMVNQLLAGVHIASAAEAMAFGARLGLNTRLLFNFITISGGTSWY
ncbi:hypothetical protein HN51_005126, partial [Arachis hypogaea]